MQAYTCRCIHLYVDTYFASTCRYFSLFHPVLRGIYMYMLFHWADCYYANATNQSRVSGFHFVLHGASRVTAPFFRSNPLKEKSRPVSSLLTRTALNATKRFRPSQLHPFILNQNKIKLIPFYTQTLPSVNISRNYILYIKTRPARQVA